MPFKHEIINLKAKPAEFLEISPTGKVPLLQLDDGSVVVESVDVARKVATTFAPEKLLPAGEEKVVDQFIDLWTNRVEPDYYSVLTAQTESQSRFALSTLLASMAAVEDLLWQRRMYDR